MPFVLIIRELGHSWAGRDPITLTFPTREEAEAELLDYVKEGWDSAVGTDRPEDDDELVEDYFESVPEEYIITEVAQTSPPVKTA